MKKKVVYSVVLVVVFLLQFSVYADHVDGTCGHFSTIGMSESAVIEFEPESMDVEEISQPPIQKIAACPNCALMSVKDYCILNYTRLNNTATHQYGWLWQDTCTTKEYFRRNARGCVFCGDLQLLDTYHWCYSEHLDCGKGIDSACIMDEQANW